MSATEDFKILMNILARTGISGDLQGEFAKAKSMMHNFDSQSLLQAQSQMNQNQGSLTSMSGQPMSSTTEGQIMPPTPPNQGETQGIQEMQGGKYDNL